MIRHKLTLILLFFIFISSVNAQEKSAHFGMGLNFGVANIVYYHDSRDNDYSHPFFFNSGILEFIQLKQLTINLGQEIYSVTIHHEPSLKYALDDYTIFSKHLRFPIGFDFHLSEKASRTIFLRLAFIPDFVYLNEINDFFPGVD